MKMGCFKPKNEREMFHLLQEHHLINIDAGNNGNKYYEINNSIR